MPTFQQALLNEVLLSEDLLNQIWSLAVAKELDKGDFWLQQGQYCNQVAFIEKGYLRKYYITGEGKEVTDFFYLPGSFTGDLPSILAGEPTYAWVEAMEKSRLYVWDYNKLMRLAEDAHPVEHLLRKMTEKGFIAFYQRARSFIMQSARERYLDLITQQPEIFKLAKQHHIASYLGITPQHLSRLKSQI